MAVPKKESSKWRANIVELKFDCAYYGVNLGDTAIVVTLETRGAAHLAELVAATPKPATPTNAFSDAKQVFVPR